ncbi:hypothetical protein N8524_06410 [Candidatus Puniceispirillum sp.]|nr:hypothetical protein [Candidatus Puniceispirillum sp.]
MLAGKNGFAVFAMSVHLALEVELLDANYLSILIGVFDGKAGL